MKKDMTAKTNVETLHRLLSWLYKMCKEYDVEGDILWDQIPDMKEKQEIENLLKEKR